MTVTIPVYCEKEARYVLQVVLHDWLQVPYDVRCRDVTTILIEHGTGSLSLDTSFFQVAGSNWLHPCSLPQVPLPKLAVKQLNQDIISRIRMHIPNYPDEIFILYGVPRIQVINKETNYVECGIDIFGSIFFMLSRYEEAVIGERDEHDRFPATASTSFRAGFLDRPLVNEYVELLWAMMATLWSGLKRRPRDFRMLVSHDVDVPYEDAFRSLYHSMRRFIGDVLKRRDLVGGLKSLHRWLRVRRGDLSADRNNTFDFIMSESEKRGIKSSFYFIPNGSSEQLIKYSVDHPIIQELIEQIDKRGHEIGLHASYDTYLNEELTRSEAVYLRKKISEKGITQHVRGGRQHFLRWSTPTTFLNWVHAGMEYDSSLGFADRPGFRCGTCWDYSVYDIAEHKPLPLKEHPLITMECTITSKRYLGLGLTEEAYNLFMRLKETCRQYQGDFTLLWHNSELLEAESRQLYLAVLDG